MSTDANSHQSRAADLAWKSLEYLKSGRQDDAVRTLREALSLAPTDEAVLQAFHHFQKDRDVPVISKLCQKLVLQGDSAAADEVLRLLRDPNLSMQATTATECLQLLLANTSKLPHSLGGEVIVEFLKVNRSGREHVVDLIENKTRETLALFENLGEIGVDAFVLALLDPAAWKSEDVKKTCLRDCFKVFLDTLKAGGGKVGVTTVARSIAKLLAVKADELHPYINQEGLEKLLSMLDIRSPVDLRSHATLAVAKFIEASENVASSMLGKFMQARLSADGDDDLRIAFSAAAAIFPLAPAVAGQLFLTEGFVEGLVPSLQGRPNEVEDAALEMMSAACIEKGCRNAIAAHCVDYLDAVVKGDDSSKGPAGIVLAKVRYGAGESGAETPKGIDELATIFKGMMSRQDSGSRDSSIEGLAYTSLKGSVKESLIKDKAFVKDLLETVQEAAVAGKSTTVFGGLTVITNLIQYLPVMSEEQKKVAELKNYANAGPKGASKKINPDPEDKEDKVTARCKILLDFGIIPVLVVCSKKITSNAIAMITTILLSLSKHQKHRGIIAQQGGVKLLLQFYASVAGNTSQNKDIRRAASHALARILVSTNPSHVFSSNIPAASAARPLLSLLENITEQKDLLPVFEALLALTNLASMDDSTRDLIIRAGWMQIEETLLSDNAMVQRATVELLCNLMASPSGIAKFADGSKPAGNRMHILLALADAEDLATRRAAGGALAMLTEWDGACKAVMERDRGVAIILGMVNEDNEELRHRGVVIVRNLVFTAEEYGRKLKEKQGVEVLTKALRTSRNPEMLSIGVEVLKKLMEK
ncbi:SWI5-dependent HO expression protein 4 [Rhizina undulata]